MSKKETAAPLRVDLYIRVSGQEQAIKGLSLEAQQENLEEYARERLSLVKYLLATGLTRKSAWRLYRRTRQSFLMLSSITVPLFLSVPPPPIFSGLTA